MVSLGWLVKESLYRLRMPPAIVGNAELRSTSSNQLVWRIDLNCHACVDLHLLGPSLVWPSFLILSAHPMLTCICTEATQA